jgi:hypothetical protein
MATPLSLLGTPPPGVGHGSPAVGAAQPSASAQASVWFNEVSTGDSRVLRTPATGSGSADALTGRFFDCLCRSDDSRAQ